MATISIEMREDLAGLITNELKEQVAGIGLTLSKHHLDYQEGRRDYDIDAEEIQRAIRRIDTINDLLKLIEDAVAKAREEKK